MAKNKKKEFDFDKNLTKLEQIVEQLEGGDMTLEKSISVYQKGVELLKMLNEEMVNAEQKVSELSDVLRNEIELNDSDE